MKLRSFAHSDIGRVRNENEDSYVCNDTLGLYGVADGIGGLPAGAQASQLAITTLQKIVSEHAVGTKLNYERILSEINDQVFQLGRLISPQFGIGSTLTFAHVTGVKLQFGHVGDSNAFRLRSKKLQQLSTDHTIETEHQHEVLTQVEEHVAKQVFRIKAEPGQPITITKVVSYHTSRQVPSRCSELAR